MSPVGALRRAWDRHNDRELFLTHTPDSERYQPGAIINQPDGLYRITRQVPDGRTRLVGGGSVACWSIRGVRLG